MEMFPEGGASLRTIVCVNRVAASTTGDVSPPVISEVPRTLEVTRLPFAFEMTVEPSVRKERGVWSKF
jgi:hypothetical protein